MAVESAEKGRNKQYTTRRDALRLLLTIREQHKMETDEEEPSWLIHSWKRRGMQPEWEKVVAAGDVQCAQWEQRCTL